MKEARLAAGVRQRDGLSQGAMGALVAEIVGRPVSQDTWSDYEGGRRPIPLDIIEATTEVSGLAKIYLAFGEGASGLPMPDPMKDRKLTLEEERRALKKADAERRAAASPSAVSPKKKKRSIFGGSKKP